MAVFRQAMADPTEADVIRTVQRDTVPGQGAIGGGELVAARAGVGVFTLVLTVPPRAEDKVVDRPKRSTARNRVVVLRKRASH